MTGRVTHHQTRMYLFSNTSRGNEKLKNYESVQAKLQLSNLKR